MTALVRPVAWVALALAAGVGACRCGAASSAPADGALPDAGPDARPDARLAADAAVDAAPPPDGWVDAAPCDATFIELPPAGTTFISMVSNWDHWVAYDYTPSQDTYEDIYLYDLNTCTEHRITNDPIYNQSQPSVWGDQIVYTNQLEGHLWTLSRFDITTGITTSFSSVNAPAISVLGAMGDFVAYAVCNEDPTNSPFYWKLFNMSTHQSVLLESTTDGARSGGDMSTTHFTWPSLVVNQYNGIWYVDLATGEKTMIENTTRGAYPTTWGDWVVWEDWRTNSPDLWGERIGAGEQIRLTNNGAYNWYPRLRGHLLCFRTTLWKGNSSGWDLALMDLDTWVVRRITRTTEMDYTCGHADGGWLVYRKQMDTYGIDKVYAVNLVKNGFLDATGHLIPE